MIKYLCVPAILQVRVTVCHGVSKSNTVPVPALPVTNPKCRMGEIEKTLTNK